MHAVRFAAVVLGGLCFATGLEAQVQRTSLTSQGFAPPAYSPRLTPSPAPAPLTMPTCEDGPVATVLLGAALGAGVGTIASLIVATGSGARSGFSKKTNAAPYIAAGAVLGAIVANSGWQRRCG